MAASMAGKTALVTGGGSGIGKATCLAFAREGAQLSVVDRNLETARQTVQEIVAAGGQALAQQVDVSREDQVQGMVEAAVRHFGALDCCFNNAGIGTTETHSKKKLLADIALADWQQMLDVNLTGVFLCLKHQLLCMAGRGGAIVNMSSIAGLTALPGAAAYVASKHGVLALTRSAAIEYADLGIRVNAVCPGHLATRIRGQSNDAADGTLLRNPMKRHGTPEEIAELVVWLASDRASFVNGAAFTADGGRLAGG